jgi:hypothetical protein
MRSSVDLVVSQFRRDVKQKLSARNENKSRKETDLLLVPPNFPQGDSTGPVPVRLLDTSGSLRGRLSSGLGSDCVSEASGWTSERRGVNRARGRKRRKGREIGRWNAISLIIE